MTAKTDSLTAALGQFRQAFYLFLSRAFSREPDWDALKGMEQVSATLMEAWELMEMPSDPDVQVSKSLLSEFWPEFRQHPDRVIEDLSREYASLFLGVGPKTVSPCESVYRSSAGLLYQATHFEVQQLYRAIGMEISEQYHEPDDHIAVELMYVAKLCEMTGEAVNTDKESGLHYLSLQREFLESHLMPWVPVFSENLVNATESTFYRAMTLLLKGFIGIDATLIGMMIQELSSNGEPEIGGREKNSKQ
jgi:TorA maturation chaperone TorD